jgi:hypothetical protein
MGVLQYLSNLWYALDRLINAMAAGNRETVSSRCGRQIVAKKPCRFCFYLCKLLDKRWKDHCIHNINK